MDLDFTEEQEMLRATVKRICEARFNAKIVRDLESDDHKFNRDFWTDLGESGMCALRVEEAYDGAGMSALDTAIIFEEFGRALASSPFLSSCILSAQILAAFGTDSVKSNWLPKIASGETIVVPAWQADDIADDVQKSTIDSVRGVLNGEKLLVPFASSADMFLFYGVDNGKANWVLVPANTQGISIVAQPNYASQALFAVRFDNVKIEAAQILNGSDDLGVNSESFGDVLIAVAAEAVGSSDRLLALTVDYANQRNQFGQPIAAFQAISHPLAECATELEGVRYLVYQAACAKDEGQPYQHFAQMAKYQATALYRHLATVSVQVHGGIGYSTDGEPQLFYRRAKYHQLMYGIADDLKKHISDHVFA